MDRFNIRLSTQYAKVKAAEEVAATPGLYETQGERRQRQQEETADYVEIWVGCSLLVRLPLD